MACANQNRLSSQASPRLRRGGWTSQTRAGLELGDLKPQSGAGVVPPGARSRAGRVRAGWGGAGREGRPLVPPSPRAAGLQQERAGGGRWGPDLEVRPKPGVTSGVCQLQGHAGPSQWDAAPRLGGRWNEAPSRQKTKSAGHLAGSKRITQRKPPHKRFFSLSLS